MARAERLLLVVFLLLSAFGAGGLSPHAAQAAGAAPLSTLGVGARAWALAGAYTASADGGAGFSWNPASPAAALGTGLGRSRAELFALQSTPVEESAFHVVSYTTPTRSGALGAALRALVSTAIPRTDAAGNVIGVFGASETVTSLNWSRAWTDGAGAAQGFALGVQAKWAAQSIDDESGGGWAADVGALGWWPGPGGAWRTTLIGASVQNAVSTPFRWTTGTEEAFDRHVRLGVGVEFGGPLSGTFRLDWSSLDGLSAGVEGRPVPAVAVRGGWRAGDGGGAWTAGLGLAAGEVSLDYAYVAEARPSGGAPSAMGDAHQISVSIGF